VSTLARSASRDRSPSANEYKIRVRSRIAVQRLLVPSAVVDELNHPRAVAAVRAWLTRVPSWLVVQECAEAADARLARLDPGERQAIQLATREHADLLLMDERPASASHVNKALPLPAP
jgi:predicted nucleic acid-binding protein